MTQYLISFGAHAMDHIPDQDAPAVARAAHAAVQEAINAGVYVSAGGLENQPASIVAIDGAVTDGPYPEAIGGFTLVDAPDIDKAVELTRGCPILDGGGSVEVRPVMKLDF